MMTEAWGPRLLYSWRLARSPDDGAGRAAAFLASGKSAQLLPVLRVVFFVQLEDQLAALVDSAGQEHRHSVQ